MVVESAGLAAEIISPSVELYEIDIIIMELYNNSQIHL
jgi:hypothetical protein